MSIVNSIISTGSPAAVYTSAGNSAITTAYICNPTVNAITANVYLVPSAVGALFANSQIYSNLTIAPNDTYILEWERILLNNGDTVQANCDTFQSLTVTVSYTGI